MVHSRREVNRLRTLGKSKHSTKWYMLRFVFWSLLLVFGFVMFMMGWVVGEFL